MRWLFHVLVAADLGWGSDGRYRPASLGRDKGGEGFVHASFRDAVLGSARLYFHGKDPAELRVLAIDPRRLDVPVVVEDTPRGPMPHIYGAIPCDAVRILSLADVPGHPDRVTGSRIGLCAFAGMTLLDLVGPLDVLSRIASMGFDPATSCEVIALTRPADDPTVRRVEVWRDSAAFLVAERYRPALDHFDVLVVPGGPSTRALEDDPAIGSYLASFPDNRLAASVCTGALLLGAAGRLRGKRATTHASAEGRLADFGATFVDQRVVDEGNLVTAGGVTAGIDLALHLVRRLAGDEARAAIASRIEWRSPVERRP
jgi:putative intracellular protease/amidase/uncharacterized protein (DUF952 family)